MPYIDDILDWLNGAKYFNQIDLKLRYYQIHIMGEDVEKMAMRTRYGLHEFLVMPFRSCNVSSMFTTLMNFIFHEKLDKFMIIYNDDILVYSKTTKEHVKHLKYILNKLHENRLFANKVKCEFA